MIASNRTISRPGFSLMEIMVVVAIIMILIGGGTMMWMNYKDQALVTKAKAGLKSLDTAVQAYEMRNHERPNDLQVLLQPDPDTGKAYCDSDVLMSPWSDRPYQYNPQGPQNNGQKADIWVDAPSGKRIGNWPGAG
jgi:prepilin-type N-terminal cleavage/methylation domain-containing protein